MRNGFRNILFLLLFFTGLSALAQGGHQPGFRGGRRQMGRMRPNGNKKLDNVKRNYLSLHLELTPRQSEQFWPLYDEYQAQLDEVLVLRHANNTATEPNGTDQFDRELNYQQKITAIQKHYYNEFLKVLPAEKAGMVFKIERDFKYELLRRLREGRNPVGN